jgi:hypothetical protein
VDKRVEVWVNPGTGTEAVNRVRKLKQMIESGDYGPVIKKDQPDFKKLVSDANEKVGQIEKSRDAFQKAVQAAEELKNKADQEAMSDKQPPPPSPEATKALRDAIAANNDVKKAMGELAWLEAEIDYIWKQGEILGDCAKEARNAPRPKLDDKDMERIQNGCLLDLSDYINPTGKQLKIDPDYQPPEDNKGRSNRQRAKEGLASILQNGDGVQLHHTTQSFFSVLDELSASFHKSVLNDPEFHPFADDPGYASWRGFVGVYKGEILNLGEIYDRIRGKYWRARF